MKNSDVAEVSGRPPGAIKTPPPGPRGLAVARAGLHVARNPVGTIRGFVDRYGDVVSVGKRLFWIVWRPEHVQQVLGSGPDRFIKGSAVNPARSVFGAGLVVSDGELWKEERRILQTIFRRHCEPVFRTAHRRALDRVLDEWSGSSHLETDLHAAMLRVFREMMFEALFGIETVDAESELARAPDAIERHIERQAWNMLPWLERLPTPRNQRFRRALGRIEEELRQSIAACRASPQGRDDVLAHLVAAQPDEPTLDERQLRDELLTLFFTGHATTAAALAWTWASIAERPELDVRLQSSLASSDRDRDLPGRVFDEAMRIWPPAWITARTASSDQELGGFALRKGMVVLVPTIVTHRSPEVWDSPESFDPDRFLPERARDRHAFAYYPFGTGPRRCLGADIARELAVETIRRILERFRVVADPDRPTIPRTSTILKPRAGVHVRLERR